MSYSLRHVTGCATRANATYEGATDVLSFAYTEAFARLHARYLIHHVQNLTNVIGETYGGVKSTPQAAASYVQRRANQVKGNSYAMFRIARWGRELQNTYAKSQKHARVGKPFRVRIVTQRGHSLNEIVLSRVDALTDAQANTVFVAVGS